MAEDKYSVELETLLNDLQKCPGSALIPGNKILAGRIQKLRAPERVIWFERLEKYSAEQRKKLHDMIHKKD